MIRTVEEDMQQWNQLIAKLKSLTEGEPKAIAEVLDEHWSSVITQLHEAVDQLAEMTVSLLTDTPSPNGTWPHLPRCNGDRRVRPGTQGVTCCCKPIYFEDAMRYLLQLQQSKLETFKQVCASEVFQEMKYGRYRDILALLEDGQISIGKTVEAIVERAGGIEPILPEPKTVEDVHMPVS